MLKWQRSTHDALEFAFGLVGRPLIKLSSIKPPVSGGAVPGELTPQENHGQAAMILTIVERAVDTNGLAYLLAHYRKELRKGIQEREVATILTRASIGAMGTGNFNQRGIERLIRIYFGEDMPMLKVRKEFGCGFSRANEFKRCVNDTLDLIGKRADAAADNALHEAKLIVEDEDQ